MLPHKHANCRHVWTASCLQVAFWLVWHVEWSGHVYGLYVQHWAAGQDVFRNAGSNHSSVLRCTMTGRSVLHFVSSLLPSQRPGSLQSIKLKLCR